jgi:hopanoid biosynthesis associated RND transporter like protein HpnN
VKRDWEAALGRLLEYCVGVACRRAVLVNAVVLLSTVGLGAYTTNTLGLNFDHVRLVSPDLPFRVFYREFAEAFPILDDALLIVVDGETPELVRRTTDELAERLSRDEENFSDVFVPGSGEFFDRHALLYLEIDELEEFADQVTVMQPVLAELMRDGSMANLARLLRLGLRENRDANWSAVLDRVSSATISLYDEYPVAVSWESLLLDGSSVDPTTRRIIIAEPVLRFESLLPAGASIDAVRRTAADLARDGLRARVRITGNPALNQEEMIGLAWDIGVSGGFCFLLVAGVLYLALRSLRLVTAAIVTLLVGLVWTAAFAAAAIGYLNLLSICFAVLFIGLGVDFGIHLGMHYADALRRGQIHDEAMRETAITVGSSLVLCTLTTSIGFYVFVPTPYQGVAELGLIAGTGMIISLLSTVTLMPALLSSWLRVDPSRLGAELRFRPGIGALWLARPRLVCGVALILGAAAVALLPSSRFDTNVVGMRDPDTESVQAFRDLLAETASSPWYIDLIAADRAAAERLAAELKALPGVERVATLADFIPADQDDKLEILADLAVLMDVPSGTPHQSGEQDVEEQISALRDLHTFLRGVDLDSRGTKLAASLRQLRDTLGAFLEGLSGAEDPSILLRALEQLLLGGLPEQVERLQTALDPSPVALEDLPPELTARMLAADGRARVQVFSRHDLADTDLVYGFVDEVRAVHPQITGLIVNILEFGNATVDSLVQALVSAVVVVGLLLALLWRRAVDVLVVLGILLLGASLTGAGMVLLGVRYNFANVVVLPLLLGVGVDSGIHLVHRWREGHLEGVGLLGTTTARAVFYSALTTVTSFGTLTLSAHGGVASLGALLVLGMVLMLICNLVVLPAVLAVLGSGGEVPPREQ